MAEKKVAIIGSGLGGLSAALRLKTLGFDVDVFEKNDSVGGKAGTLLFDGFRFDTGPSLITMPFVLENLFESAGLNIYDYIKIEQLDIICKYYYSDSTVLNAFSDVKKFGAEIEAKTTDMAIDVEEYLTYCKRIYDLSANLFLFKSFAEIKDIFSMEALKTMMNLRSLDTHRTMHQANSTFFKDPKTIQLFDRYATYNGSNPFQAPATLNIIQHVEYNLGGYIIPTGIHSIPQAIKRAAEGKGVRFFLNTSVEKIVHENGIVKGIESGGEFKKYDIVVSNSDVENTYKNLLNDYSSKSSKKYSKLEKSTSALVFYWGVEGFHPELEIHNILFSKDYKREFDQLFEKKILPDDPTVYIYISSKFKKDDAPNNHENWFVMVNAPQDIGQNWKVESDKIRDIVLKKIERVLKIDIAKKIRAERVLTPATIEERTSSIGGSIYGISSNNKMAAFLRQRNRSKDYKGLYFCGGSAHPGGGIPLVVLSGKIASEQIEKYELN